MSEIGRESDMYFETKVFEAKGHWIQQQGTLDIASHGFICLVSSFCVGTGQLHCAYRVGGFQGGMLSKV